MSKDVASSAKETLRDILRLLDPLLIAESDPVRGMSTRAGVTGEGDLADVAGVAGAYAVVATWLVLGESPDCVALRNTKAPISWHRTEAQAVRGLYPCRRRFPRDLLLWSPSGSCRRFSCRRRSR